MLVLSRGEGDRLTFDEGPKVVTLTVIKVNKWRWWRWWREATVVLQVDGPEGTSAMARGVPLKKQSRTRCLP